MPSALRTSLSVDWPTPKATYDILDAEFHFRDDPCPLGGKGMTDGLAREWVSPVYVNPPYGRECGKWVQRGYEESQRGKTVVMLLPGRTDTAWFHDYVLQASEIRFIRGRLKFGESVGNAPFPSMVVVFRGISNA